jgi:hypothetical protein
MVRATRWVCLLLPFLVVGCGAIDDLLGGNAEEKAMKRVERLFDTVSRQGTSGTKEFQEAVCTFWKDKLLISDSGEFELAYDATIEFLGQGGLAQGFKYTIDEFEETADGIVLYGTANGNKYELLVPEKRPFRWRLAPKSGY